VISQPVLVTGTNVDGEADKDLSVDTGDDEAQIAGANPASSADPVSKSNATTPVGLRLALDASSKAFPVPEVANQAEPSPAADRAKTDDSVAGKAENASNEKPNQDASRDGAVATGTDTSSSMAVPVAFNLNLNGAAVEAFRTAAGAISKVAGAAVMKQVSPNERAANMAPGASGAASDVLHAAATPGGSGVLAQQLAAMMPPGINSELTKDASISNANSGLNATQAAHAASGSDGSKAAATDSTDSKQHAQLPADDTGSKASSQQAQSSSNSTQIADSLQNPAPVQGNLADHAMAATAHSLMAGNGAPAQAGATNVGGLSAAGKTQESGSSVQSTAPETLPAINSARLIQNMGQTEMRVGMRSAEFGNISISTFSGRDSISAQISVDHGELAKTIAAGLPEMQARLGGNQGMNVRVEMNGTGTMGQGTGTTGQGSSSGTQNGSDDQSRGNRPQPGDAASGYAGNRIAGQPYATVPAATLTSEGRGGARLDIRA
jgi:hypothetical protein